MSQKSEQQAGDRCVSRTGLLTMSAPQPLHRTVQLRSELQQQQQQLKRRSKAGRGGRLYGSDL